jgi:hypothetical protein
MLADTMTRSVFPVNIDIDIGSYRIVSILLICRRYAATRAEQVIASAFSSRANNDTDEGTKDEDSADVDEDNEEDFVFSADWYASKR